MLVYTKTINIDYNALNLRFIPLTFTAVIKPLAPRFPRFSF